MVWYEGKEREELWWRSRQDKGQFSVSFWFDVKMRGNHILD